MLKYLLYQLTGLKMLVFHAITQIWFLYRKADAPILTASFVQQTRRGNHFETVLLKNRKTATSM